MERRDKPYRHAVLEALQVLRGQWTVAVLATVGAGQTQYKDLLPAINGVEERAGWVTRQRPLSDRVLSDTLRRMHADGLVDRQAEPGNFGGVWYSLTPKGRSLLVAVRPLAEWAQEFPPAPPDASNASDQRK
jgi:DNA-binding HxlR family transcriptional regulator